MVEAIAVSLNYDKAKLALLNSILENCSNHSCSKKDPCNSCQKKSLNQWTARKKKIQTWQKYIDELQLAHISKPSTLEDIFQIEELKRGFKFHLYEFRDGYFSKLYQTDIANKETVKNIYLLRSV